MKYLEIGKDVVISESAYATVVYYAVSEIEGVSLSKSNRKEITEKQLRQLVSLDVTDYGVEVNINIELCFGMNFESVCKKIQDNVIDVVSSSIGYEPACVNIHVVKVFVC